MSGPVTPADALPEGGPSPAERRGVEVSDGRQTEVGGIRVRRALPQRARRTVGPWCFVDHIGPARETPLAVGPHPHIGLQTVTWLLDGEVLHRDSLGSEQVIRPGQLNLMTAGHGVSHAEEATAATSLHGVQLWIAQPSATRDGPPAFEHHGELPRVSHGDSTVTVLAGAHGAHRSPARCDTDHVGLDLDLRPGRSTLTLPLRADFEHAVVVLSGALDVGGTTIAPGALGYLGTGRDELAVTTEQPARALLLGGLPFPEPVLMWWNYVARTRDEISVAHRQWAEADERFGTVASPLARISAGPPPWTGGGPSGPRHPGA